MPKVLRQPKLQPIHPHCYTNPAVDIAKEGHVRVSLRGLCTVAAMFSAAVVCAQQASAPEIPPAQLVRETVAREISTNASGAKHMFRSDRETPKGSQTRLYVETKDAMAGMLIAVNGLPLPPQQQQAENDRLAGLMNNPDMLRKKHSREKEDADRTLRIVKALPDAFRYEYEGAVSSEEGLGKIGDPLVRLKFTPNPSYSPPSRVEQVLEGMQGYLLIDPEAKRIARIDGILFRDVSFGWGIIGHLDKGGHFLVQQADVGEGAWEITVMSLKITGKILLLKSISMISDETFSDFRSVPENLSFAEGVDLLNKEREQLEHDASSHVVTKKSPQ